MGEVRIGDTDLTVQQIAEVAAGRAVSLAPAARDRAAASAEFADRQAGQRALYGRSTGVGANRTVQVPAGAEHAAQLIRSHATSAGPVRSRQRIRATLVIRLGQLAAGGSGAAPALLDGLAGLIDADTLPPIREWGSVGTGDLSALGTTALVLAGELAALAGAPPRTVAFGPADGLAFLSSNAATLADAALALHQLRCDVRASVVITAMSFEVIRGNPEAFAEVVEQVTPFPGAIQICRWLRNLVHPGVTPARIQDPFGWRTFPQVHGPVLDAVDAAIEVVERLVNAPTENPTLQPPTADHPGGVAHHGGFHHAYLQQALDAANLAVAAGGQLVMARLAGLIDPALTGLTPFLSDGTPGASGIMVCEYVAGSALGELRAAALPAGLQTVTLSRGVEEDASFASQAARQTLRVAAAYRTMLAVELVATVRALRLSGHAVPAVLTELPAGAVDRDLTPELQKAEQLIPRLDELLGSDASELDH